MDTGYTRFYSIVIKFEFLIIFQESFIRYQQKKKERNEKKTKDFITTTTTTMMTKKKFASYCFSFRSFHINPFFLGISFFGSLFIRLQTVLIIGCDMSAIGVEELLLVIGIWNFFFFFGSWFLIPWNVLFHNNNKNVEDLIYDRFFFCSASRCCVVGKKKSIHRRS